jgi:hypothetical protein
MNAARAVRGIQTEGGAVLQNTENGATFSTNLAGARIWKYITKGSTKDEIVDQLSTEFDVPKERVDGDVEEFVKALKHRGLLEGDVSRD